MSLKQMQALDANKEALAQPEQGQFALKHRIAELEGAVIGLQAQRTWVGLTDEDFQPMVQKAMAYYGYKPEHSTLTSGAGFYALVRNIEAKLKEKNT